MKCNKHFATDLTSIDGVCSTCLTERLIIVIEAQTRANLESKLAGKSDRTCTSSGGESPEQICVSPSGNCKRVESGGVSVSDSRFYSTPQVLFKKKVNKFSMVSNFFRSKDPNSNSDPDPCLDPKSSPWRIKSMLPTKPKKKSCIFNSDASRVMQRPCKGMSPADESDGDLNSLESTPQWKETPSRMTTPMHFRCKKMNPPRNLTGFAFCLSPLVRPSPNRKAPEIVISGDTRVPMKPHIGAAAAFCANRSKKLANCGRFQPNY
ncbi:hypothetical protein ACET3Z_031082 [Daucus carota]